MGVRPDSERRGQGCNEGVPDFAGPPLVINSHIIRKAQRMMPTDLQRLDTDKKHITTYAGILK